MQSAAALDMPFDHEPLVQPSQLLTRLFSGLEEQPFSVLDIGGVVPETVEFFSRFPCQLYVADLLDDLCTPTPPSEDCPDEAEAAFAERFEFLQNASVDLILFWDYPNYLPGESLTALSRALSPYMHARTRGHAFAALNARQPIPAARYGIDASGALSTRPPVNIPPTHSHTQGELAEGLESFRVERGTLRDGRVEVLLERL